MSVFNTAVMAIAERFGARLNRADVVDVVKRGRIGTREEAKAILEFSEAMHDLAVAEKGTEPEALYDVEKVYTILDDFVEDEGYGDLIPED